MHCISNVPNGAQDDNDRASTITLRPVMDGSEENKNFYRWTPGGELTLGLTRPETAAKFEVGKAYYIDISSAD